MKKLSGKKILMFVDDIYEDLELWYPKLRLIEEGASVTVAGPEAGRIYEGKNGYPCRSDISYNNVAEKDFDGLVIPGGFAPDKLRRVPKVLELTRQFNERGKLVAHICHGGWIPISAKIMKGYKCTSTPGIKDDIENAGALWIDAPVVIDRNMVSSRRPDDLPEFCIAIIDVLSKAGEHGRQPAQHSAAVYERSEWLRNTAIDDGYFDVTLLNKTSRSHIIKYLPKIYTGNHVKMKEAETFRAGRIKIETTPEKFLHPVAR